MLVCVPVRYPLTDASRATLRRAVEIATDEAAMLAVVHVDLYQDDRDVTPKALERGVRNAVDVPRRTRYVIREGFILEETLLETVVELDADVVVIGEKQERGFQRLAKLVFPDTGTAIDDYLREQYDCDCIIVDSNE